MVNWITRVPIPREYGSSRKVFDYRRKGRASSVYSATCDRSTVLQHRGYFLSDARRMKSRRSSFIARGPEENARLSNERFRSRFVGGKREIYSRPGRGDYVVGRGYACPRRDWKF